MGFEEVMVDEMMMKRMRNGDEHEEVILVVRLW